MRFDIPAPEVHAAVVLACGTRYVGHVKAVHVLADGDIERFVVEESGDRVHGPRIIEVVADHVAAVESWPGRTVIACRACQPARERIEP